MRNMKKHDVAWDLSEIFPSTTDPSIQKAVDNLAKMADGLARKYKGKIKDFSAKEALKCIQEFELYQAKLRDLSLFAGLSFAANMTLPDTQTLYDKINKLEAKLGKTLAFFDLEFGPLVDKNPRLIRDPTLATYRHALIRLRRQVAHQLSEIEEQLVIEKDQFGVRAWEDLQSKWLNT